MRKNRRLIAIIISLAMIAVGIIYTPPAQVKSDETMSYAGYTYNVHYESSTISGFVCQGMFDYNRIAFAWGEDLVVADITNTITGHQSITSLPFGEKNARGCNFSLASLQTLGEGSFVFTIGDGNKSASFTMTITFPPVTTTTVPETTTLSADWISTGGGSEYTGSFPGGDGIGYFYSANLYYRTYTGGNTKISFKNLNSEATELMLASDTVSIESGKTYDLRATLSCSEGTATHTNAERGFLPASGNTTVDTVINIGDNTLNEAITATSTQSCHAFFKMKIPAGAQVDITGFTVREEEPADYSQLDFIKTENILTIGGATAACAYAICGDESTADMANAASTLWGIATYNGSYAGITWHSGTYENPDEVTLNGVDLGYSASGPWSPPINDAASTLIHINTSQGFNNNSYNVMKVMKGEEYVTIVFQVGNVVAPDTITLEKPTASGNYVPGCVNVSWTKGENTPDNQTFNVYVDDELAQGGLTGTSTEINNLSEGTHTIKVTGYYNNEESEGVSDDVTIGTGVLYSSEIDIEGFQIKANNNASGDSISFRTMCKAPSKTKKNSGGQTVTNTISVNGTNYSIENYGTIYALDTNNTGDNSRNAYDASYTLLNPTPTSGTGPSGAPLQYKYTGLRSSTRTYGYIASGSAIISNWKETDTDNTYYAFTMMDLDSIATNTIWVRPFIEAKASGSNETVLIYGHYTAFTSVAEIAHVLYTGSMSKNITAHNYLYNSILHNTSVVPTTNPFYMKTEVTYGWNGNLYTGYRLVPDAFESGQGQGDNMLYIKVGDYYVHANSWFKGSESGAVGASASYKGFTNEELGVRVEQVGAPQWFQYSEGDGWYNWGIQIKRRNDELYSRLIDGKSYNMVIRYKTNKAGTMWIKREGDTASGYSHDNEPPATPSSGSTPYTGADAKPRAFAATAGVNTITIPFVFHKYMYVDKPNDCSVVFSLAGGYGGNGGSASGWEGFEAGTIISDIDIGFTEITG